MLLIAFPLPWLKTSGMLLIGIYVFFSMAALLALALGIGSAHSGEFPTDLVFAALVFAFAALTLAGLAFGSGLSESASEHAALPATGFILSRQGSGRQGLQASPPDDRSKSVV